jgi:hypothetical protein
MLIFIDESGDPGLKTNKGSSRYFTVCLVVFEDNEEALACDQRIQLLKKEVGWEASEEFHFSRNSNKIRGAFMSAVAPYNFFYYGIVINKDENKLWGDVFKNKESFYKYTCGLVFENAKEKLNNATIIIDESGNMDFKHKLASYLRMKTKSGAIKKVKMQRSESNNLLQLADYVSGIINRSVRNNKKHADDYRKKIAHKEMYVQIWPK